ncbi:hypothetical protein SUGI_0645050 [Cryptomeria japonica]|nr:hypothetical protein SUGI_0645050 [Cryptomeria japonica]
MPLFVGLSYVNCGHSLERQCLNLFILEEEICGAIISLVDCSLSLERHWCDGLVYGAVITPIVDILESRVEGVGLMQGFVNPVNIHVVADAIFELREGTRESILRLYFEPVESSSFASDSEDSLENSHSKEEGAEGSVNESEAGEDVDEAKEEGVTDMTESELEEGDVDPAEEAHGDDQRRIARFAREAWHKFKAGVMNDNLDSFRMLLESEDWWLSEGSTDNLLSIGEAVLVILRFIRQS